MSEGLNSSLETLFSKMENFVSTKTVVGEAIHFNDVTILPLVDVVVGVGAGAGSDKKESTSGGGGGGLGAKITPSAVLVIQNGSVQLVNVKNQDSVNKLIDMVPSIVSKLNIFGKGKKNEDEEDIKVTEVIFEEKQEPDTIL